MNYTREQALEAFLDYRKYHELSDELHESEIEFINAKFPTIEVGKWYKDTTSKLFKYVLSVESDRLKGFGFNMQETWTVGDFYSFNIKSAHKELTPATDQEVLDRLTDEAKKRYKVGDRVLSFYDGDTYTSEYTHSGRFVLEDKYFSYQGVCVLNLSTGEWAEVVESATNSHSVDALRYALDYGKAVSQARTEVVYHIGDEEVKPTSIHDKIEKLERELAELKQLINK